MSETNNKMEKFEQTERNESTAVTQALALSQAAVPEKAVSASAPAQADAAQIEPSGPISRTSSAGAGGELPKAHNQRSISAPSQTSSPQQQQQAVPTPTPSLSPPQPNLAGTTAPAVTEPVINVDSGQRDFQRASSMSSTQSEQQPQPQPQPPQSNASLSNEPQANEPQSQQQQLPTAQSLPQMPHTQQASLNQPPQQGTPPQQRQQAPQQPQSSQQLHPQQQSQQLSSQQQQPTQPQQQTANQPQIQQILAQQAVQQPVLQAHMQPYAAVMAAPMQPAVFATTAPHYVTGAPTHVVGMVGTTPIVKMQGATGQVVKTKKGRFNLLAHQSTPPAPAPGAKTNSAKQQQQQQRADLQAAQPATDAAGAPANIQANVQGNRERSSSNMSGVSAASNPTGSRTFDGTSVPMVKKKGRFMVSNVKDPGSLGASAQVAPTQSVVTTQMPPQVMMQTAGNGTIEASQLSTGSGPTAYHHHHATMMSVVAPSGHLMQQPVYYTTAPQHGQSYPQMATYTLQQPMMAMAPAPIPMAANPNLESSPPQGVSHSPPPPVAPGAPTTEEGGKPKAKVKPAQQPQQRRAATAPRSTPVVGIGGEAGLGKVLYFLDQMRAEVTVADRTIKSLQTDAKFLREKNKELEAKAREAARKLNEERGLREAAEGRVKALRKKLRGLKDESGAVNDPEAAKEEEGTGSIAGRHSQTDSLDYKELAGLDISPDSGESGGDDSKSSLFSQPVLPSSTLPVKRETSAGTGVSAEANKPTAVDAQGSSKTPPRGSTTGQHGQGNGQKRSPNSTVPVSSESAAQINTGIALPSRAGVQRNSSTGSLPAVPIAAQQQTAQPPEQKTGVAMNGQAKPIHIDGASRATSMSTPMNGGMRPDAVHPMQSQAANNAQTDSSAPHGSRPVNQFDPLRPSPHGHPSGIPTSDSTGSLQAVSQAPVFMMNQHTMAVPVLSVPASAVEGASNLLGYQAQPTMQVSHPHGSPTSQSYPDMIEGSGSFEDIQQPMFLVSQHQLSGMQQPQMMTIQQPVQFQWTQSNGYHQSGGHHQAVSGASSASGTEQTADPFDELVTRRPPSNHAQ